MNNKLKKVLIALKINYIWRFFLKVKISINYLIRLGFKDGFSTIWNFKFSKSRLIKVKTKVNKYPVYVRKGTTDSSVFQQIFIDREYNFPIDFQPKNIVDCGAYNGFSAIYFSQKYKDAKIVAVEPEKSNFDILKKNIQKYKNIKAINSAIWSKNTYLTIENSRARNWSFRVIETKNKKEGFKAVTIEKIMKDNKMKEIDILKLDIEGSEMELFRNDNCEKWLKKTKMLFLELHESYSPGVTKVVYKRMKKHNFRKFTIGENEVFIK